MNFRRLLWSVLVAWALISTSHMTSRDSPAAPPALDDEPPTLSTLGSVEVRRFRFEGNTIFSDDELAVVLAAYLNRRVTIEALDEARQALTRHYVDHGYINSGAFLDDQAVVDGTITIGIIEGRLTDVSLDGPVWLDPSYILDRVRLGGEAPLHLPSLQEQLELLRQNPNIERIQAELRPGIAPGDSDLSIHVEEANAFHLGLRFDNHRSPSIGAERFGLLLRHTNLTGHGDRLHVDYSLTRDGFDDMDFAGLDLIDIAYTLPVTAYDTTLTVIYSRQDTLVVEEPFDQIDLTSETREFILALRHPLYQSPTTQVAFWLAG